MDQPSTPTTNMQPTAKELREKLQQDIVSIITKRLESGEMTEERAKAIAKMALEKLPEGIAYEDFMKVVPTLDDEFEELKVAVLPIIIDYQNKMALKVQQKINELMNRKQYTQALQLAQQAIEFENKLV